MTESETRMMINFGIEHGIENASEIPDEVVDKICDPQCNDFDRYDDTPTFISLERLDEIMHRIESCHYVEWEADDIMDKIREEV